MEYFYRWECEEKTDNGRNKGFPHQFKIPTWEWYMGSSKCFAIDRVAFELMEQYIGKYKRDWHLAHIASSKRFDCCVIVFLNSDDDARKFQYTVFELFKTGRKLVS